MSSVVEYTECSALERKDGSFAAWNFLASLVDEKFHFVTSLEVYYPYMIVRDATLSTELWIKSMEVSSLILSISRSYF